MLDRLKRYLIYAAVFLVLLGLAGLTGYCARDRAARREAAQAARSADEAALRAAGALTAERATRDQLETEASALSDQLARLRAVVPGVEVREVTRWRTEACQVGGAPLPEPPIVAGCGAPTRPCLLRPGDSLDVRAVEATVESASGARGLVGQAEVWRLTPPETLLGRAPVKSGRIVASDADLSTRNEAPDAGVFVGLGGGAIDAPGGVVPALASVAVGPPIRSSRWHVWAHGAISTSTVRVGSETVRPWTITGGLGRWFR